MSHGIRRLWTGVIVLLWGCQSVSSTMPSVFPAMPDRATSALTNRQLSEAHAEPDVAEQAVPTPVVNPSDRANEIGYAGSSASDQVHAEDASPDSLHRNIKTREVTAALPSRLHESRRPTAVEEPDRSEPHMAAPGEAATDDIPALRGLRGQPFETKSDATFIESSLVQAHALQATDDFTTSAEGEDTGARVQQASHEDTPAKRRNPFRNFGRTLEAPTPFSAISRRKASEEPDNHQSEAPSVRPAIDDASGSEDGFVGTLFDAFGIGGDRAGQSKSEGVTPLRRGEVADLQRPPTAEISINTAPPPSVAALTKSLQTVHWQEELDRLTALLETQLASQKPGPSAIEQDYYIRQHVALRLLYLIGSRRPEALQAIPDCDPDQQEFWIELLWALSNIFDDEAMPDRAARARETATRLREALVHLAPEAGLRLTQTQFCRQINSFGNYLPFEQDEFSPGQSVLVYTEVENFVSRATPDGEFITTLQSTLRIQEGDATGPVVFEEELPATEDRCFSRRQDYFHSYRIALPSQLNPGRHVLTLTVRDENSQKISTAQLNFVIR